MLPAPIQMYWDSAAREGVMKTDASLNSTQGGDESRRSPAAAVAEARQTAAGNAGEEGAVAPLVPLVTFSDLGSAVGKSRALSEGLWGRAFLTEYIFIDTQQFRRSWIAAR